MRSKNAILCGLVAASCVLTACAGGGVEGTPVSDTSALQESDPSASENESPKNDIPEVSDPLEVGVLTNDICSAMDEEQVGNLPGKIVDVESEKDQHDLSCRWTYDGDRYRLGAVIVGLNVEESEGISKYYNDSGGNPSDVRPVDPIYGYPAVQLDLGHTNEGICVYEVGVRDDLTFSSQVILEGEHPSRDTPCEMSKQIAEIVIANLEEQQ